MTVPCFLRSHRGSKMSEPKEKKTLKRLLIVQAVISAARLLFDIFRWARG